MAINDQLNFQTHQYVSPTDDLYNTLGAGGIFAQTLKNMANDGASQLSDYKNLIDMQRQDVQDQRATIEFNEKQQAYQQQQDEINGEYKTAQELSNPRSNANKNAIANSDYKNVVSGTVGPSIYNLANGKTTSDYSPNVVGASLPENSFLQQAISTTGSDGKLIPNKISTNDLMIPTGIIYSQDADGNPIIATTNDKGNITPLTSLQAYARNANGLRTGTDATGSQFVFDDKSGNWYGTNSNGTKGALVASDRQKNVTETMQDVPINQDALKKSLIDVVENEAKNPVYNESPTAIVDRVAKSYTDNGNQVPLSVLRAQMTAHASDVSAEAAKNNLYDTLTKEKQVRIDERNKVIGDAVNKNSTLLLDSIKKGSGVEINSTSADGSTANPKFENLEEKSKADALTSLYALAKTQDNQLPDTANNIKSYFLKYYGQGYSPSDIKLAMIPYITSTKEHSGTDAQGKPTGDYLKQFSSMDMSGFIPRTPEQQQLANGISISKNSSSSDISKVYKQIASVSSDLAKSQVSNYDAQIAELQQKINDVYSSPNAIQDRQATLDSNRIYADMFPGFKNIDQTTRENDDKNSASQLQSILTNSVTPDSTPTDLFSSASKLIKARENQNDYVAYDDHFDSNHAIRPAIGQGYSISKVNEYVQANGLAPIPNNSAQANTYLKNLDPTTRSKYYDVIDQYSKAFMTKDISTATTASGLNPNYPANIPLLSAGASAIHQYGFSSSSIKSILSNVGFYLKSGNKTGAVEYLKKTGYYNKHPERANDLIAAVQNYDVSGIKSVVPNNAGPSDLQNASSLDLQKAIAARKVAEDNYQQSKHLDWTQHPIAKIGATWDSFVADHNADYIQNKRAYDDYDSKINVAKQQQQALIQNNVNNNNDIKILLKQQEIKSLEKSQDQIMNPNVFSSSIF